MSFEKAHACLAAAGFADRVHVFDCSSATVALAAEALHCEESRIAKTLSFRVGDAVVLIVAAGDRKVDNAKFRAQFGVKAKMLAAEEVEPLVGHGVGGVCPFAVNEGVTTYLDISLQRFDTVYPACGSADSAVELTPGELTGLAHSAGWVDVCK